MKKQKLFQNQCDKWIKTPTWRSEKHEVEPKCLPQMVTNEERKAISETINRIEVAFKADVNALKCVDDDSKRNQ